MKTLITYAMLLAIGAAIATATLQSQAAESVPCRIEPGQWGRISAVLAKVEKLVQ